MVAAGQQDEWDRLKRTFSRHPFVLQRSSSELKQVVEECCSVAPCTLLVDYDFLMNSDRPAEFSKIVRLKSISVLVQLREPKPDEALGISLTPGVYGIFAGGITSPTIVSCRARGPCRGDSAPRKLLSVVLRNLCLARDPRSLTPRETEILTLVARGYSNQQISEALHIARETVRWNMRMIYGKLGVHDRQSAVLQAFGSGPRKPSAPKSDA